MTHRLGRKMSTAIDVLWYSNGSTLASLRARGVSAVAVQNLVSAGWVEMTRDRAYLTPDAVERFWED